MSASFRQQQLIAKFTEMKIYAASFGTQEDFLRKIATLSDIEIAELKSLNQLDNDYNPEIYRH